MCSVGEEKKRLLKLAIEAMEKVEEEIKGKEFFGGESIGYLDIALGWISYWLPVCEEIGSIQILDPLKFPATASWVSKFLNHPIIKDNLPPRQKMIPYFHERSKFLSTLPRGWIKI